MGDLEEVAFYRWKIRGPMNRQKTNAFKYGRKILQQWLSRNYSKGVG
jgi:hypothetical protein